MPTPPAVPDEHVEVVARALYNAGACPSFMCCQQPDACEERKPGKPSRLQVAARAAIDALHLCELMPVKGSSEA